MYFPSVFTTSLSSTPSVITLVVEYSVLAADSCLDSCLFVDDASDIMPVASALSNSSPNAVSLMEASAFFTTSYNFP